MVFKTFLAVILTAFLSFSVQASPAQQEKRAFCETVAKNYEAGAEAKKGGMTADELEGRIMMFAMNLIQNGMPDELIRMLVQPIVDGYFGRSSAELHFKGCMSKEMI